MNLLNFGFIYKLEYLPSGLNSPIDPQKNLAKFG